MSKPRRYGIFWSDWAIEDLNQITSYMAVQNPAHAYKLWRNIHAATERLHTLPLRCRIVPELKEIGVETYRETIVDVYRIMIRVQDTSVWILGVFDSRRDLEDVLLQRIAHL